MVVNVEQIQRGVLSFVEKEIAEKATGLTKFGIYFILPTISKQTMGYVDKLKAVMPEVLDENGNIKIDEVYNNAKIAVKKSGQFEYMGIIFNETDIDKLYTYIKGV
jgi:hypothetical protein